MRHLLAAWMVFAIGSMAFSEETFEPVPPARSELPVLVPKVVPPSPYSAPAIVPQAELTPTPAPPMSAPYRPEANSAKPRQYAPSYAQAEGERHLRAYRPRRPGEPADQIQHLLQAAAHLEAAGRSADAERYRREAGDAVCRLQREVESLRTEVEQLRKAGDAAQAEAKPASELRQIMLHLKAFEFSRTKLKRLGMDFGDSGLAEFEQPAKAGTSTYGVVKNPEKLTQFIDALEKDHLIKVLADPTLVTVSERLTSFNSGGEIAIPTATSGDTPTEWKQYGTQIDCVPKLLPDGQIHLNIRASFSSLDEQHAVMIHNSRVPGIKIRTMDTGVNLRSGQILLMRGLVQKRPAEQATVDAAAGQESSEEEIEFYVMLSAQIVEPVDGPMMRERPPVAPQK